MRRLMSLLSGFVLAATLASCGLFSGEGPWPKAGPPSVEQGLAHQYAARERTIEFSHDAAGVLQMTQTLIFDAGDQPRSDTLRIGLGAVLIGSDNGIRQSVQPEFSDFSAVDVTNPAAPTELGIEIGPAPWSERVQLLQVSAPDGWTPGRHAVVVSMRIAGAWRLIDGESRLVLPYSQLRAPWYPYQEPTEYTTLSVGGLPIHCLSRRDEVALCNEADPTRLSSWGDFPGDIAGNQQPRYIFVRPTDITAQPTAPEEEPA